MLSEYLVRYLFSTRLCLSVRDSAGSGTIRPAKAICTKLEPTLDPEVLELLMESSGHISHRAVEVHFRAAVVDSRFQGLSPLQWHWLVHTVLSEGLVGLAHALTI
ncbi:bolA-like protein 1 [Lagenorhynchus albirostris]|uniref:bolA-like protein 1 n=1 Tax=Lagenorhynchus albirostris TaxID=27610 RepID=UPI0028E70E79|nr:bolA-like protein 1 [Lagenorhynchus albirostris]